MTSHSQERVTWATHQGTSWRHIARQGVTFGVPTRTHHDVTVWRGSPLTTEHHGFCLACYLSGMLGIVLSVTWVGICISKEFKMGIIDCYQIRGWLLQWLNTMAPELFFLHNKWTSETSWISWNFAVEWFLLYYRSSDLYFRTKKYQQISRKCYRRSRYITKLFFGFCRGFCLPAFTNYSVPCPLHISLLSDVFCYLYSPALPVDPIFVHSSEMRLILIIMQSFHIHSAHQSILFLKAVLRMTRAKR